MFDWQEWRKEIRENRKGSPVETFALLLVLAFLVVCFASVVAIVLYYVPIPMISVTVVIVVLWKLYQRI